MAYSLVDVSAIVCSVACIGLLKSWLKRRDKLPLPPGPEGLPLIGNLLDMPEADEWEAARKWGEKYGPVIHVRVLGTHYIFLNSYEAAVDLLERCGANYSSRPSNVMFDMEAWTETFPGAMPYGDELKRSRGMLHRYLQPSAVGDYLEIQTRSTHKVLERLLKTPDRYSDLVRYSAGEAIMMVTYGYQVAGQNDPYVELGDKALAAFAEAEGFFLVNMFPLLQYLPSWIPGTGFKKIAKNGRQLAIALYQRPHEMMKKRMSNGAAVPCMSTKLMEANTGKDGVIRDEELIAKTTGITYAGGADTTVSTMLTFLLAMVLHPEVQNRAKEELDRVVGKNNLPSFDDRPNLPYVNAICKELLRWQPVTPLGKFDGSIDCRCFPDIGLGTAHTATEEDEYDGYRIPAGATILSNMWAMSRDTSLYEKPDEFIPERWLPTDGKERPLDSHKISFGFGRRICRGRHFADNSIFIGVASILAAFDISKALNESGQPITPKIDYFSHFIRHPKPFKYSIKPRSVEVEKAIHQAVESAQ